MKTLRKVILVLLTLLFSAMLGFFGYYLFVTSGKTLDHDKLCLSTKNVRVFDGNGEEIEVFSSPLLQKAVPITALPNHVKYAFIDVEDKRFYSHNGFDVRRIIGATLENLRAGSFKQGASTISQQLIKNTHLSHEKTLKRKLQEFKLTRQLEKRYKKDQILEKYLNTIYFGHNCFGIQSASAFYFDKSPSELSIADSAILAGLVRSPNNYSPFKHPEASKKRRNLVLRLMLEQGHLTNEEYNQALLAPLPEEKDSSTLSSEKFLSAVIAELDTIAEEFGFTVSDQLCVYTKFNPALQSLLETLSKRTNTDSAMLVQENGSGLYKAFYSTATLRRSPGSAIKPLLVYAPAIEEGLLSPATPILDEQTNFSGYKPKNYNGAYFGYVSARECLSKSLNVPAVKILNQTGVKKSVAYLEKVGMNVPIDDYSLALALGGMKNGFSLQELVNGYFALANEGTFVHGGFIEKVISGSHVLYQKQQSKNRVFSAETAYLLTDMLKTAATDGTAKKLRSLPFPIAAKTGTVGTEKGNLDAYALSYTTKDVVGVWLGNKSNAQIEHTGGGLPCNFSLKINEYLYENYKSKNETIADFSRPNSIVEIALDKTEYAKNQQLILCDDLSPTSERFTELFQEKNAPTKKSTKYTRPVIEQPTITYRNGVVQIDIKERTLYTFLIERECENKKTLLFQGTLSSPFIDKTVEQGKVYIYTITPIFNSISGTPFQTPKINTETAEPPPNFKNEDWWNE